MKKSIWKASFSDPCDLANYLYKNFISYPDYHCSFELALYFGNSDDYILKLIYVEKELEEVFTSYNPSELFVSIHWQIDKESFDLNYHVFIQGVEDGDLRYHVFLDYYDKD